MAKTKKTKKAEPENPGALLLRERDAYEQMTQDLRTRWEDLWKLYTGELPASKNKSLSRNFIPKVHQAVEVAASFLVGNQPTIIATPVGADDDDKAKFMGRLLEFQWQYVLKMKPKVLTWVKSSILFGIGIMKIGWDAEKDEPFAYPLNIGNFYTDPHTADAQESPSCIERIVLPLETAKKMYGVDDLQSTFVKGDTNDDGIFENHDLNDGQSHGLEKVELLERWTLDKVITIAVQQDKESDNPVGRVIKEMKNPYGFIPYVPVKFKDSPIPNRFYPIGAIEPVARVQKRMNQLVNQIVDNVNLVMSPPALVRRGAGIDPRELVLSPTKAVTLNDIDRDVKFVTIPDTTGTGFNLYRALDMEFQNGTTISNPAQMNSDSATEARIQQANLNTQTILVKENVEYAIGLLGQFLAQLNIKNIDSVRSIRIFDPQDVMEFDSILGNQRDGMSEDERMDIQKNGRVVNIDKGQLDGEFDIRVKADSTLLQNRDVLRKQLLDYVSFLNSIGVQLDVQRLSEKWGELSGIPNVGKFIQKEKPPAPPPDPEIVVKTLQAISDMKKAGIPITLEQVDVAMQKAGLPGYEGGTLTPPSEEEMAQQQRDVGPGGGQSSGGPTRTDTSEGMTGRAIEATAGVQTPGVATQ